MTLHEYVQFGGTGKILSSSVKCITPTSLQLQFGTQQMRVRQCPLPVKSYKSPSIDVRRFVNSRRRLASIKSEIQQIRSKINLGADIATVNDDKRTESAGVDAAKSHNDPASPPIKMPMGTGKRLSTKP